MFRNIINPAIVNNFSFPIISVELHVTFREHTDEKEANIFPKYLNRRGRLSGSQVVKKSFLSITASGFSL